MTRIILFPVAYLVINKKTANQNGIAVFRLKNLYTLVFYTTHRETVILLRASSLCPLFGHSVETPDPLSSKRTAGRAIELGPRGSLCSSCECRAHCSRDKTPDSSMHSRPNCRHESHGESH